MYFLVTPRKTTVICISLTLLEALRGILLNVLFYTAPEMDEQQKNQDCVL